MKFKVIFNEKIEAEKIKTCLNRLSWYKKNNYRIDLPKKIYMVNISSMSEIKKAVFKEFKRDTYKKIAEKLINSDKLCKNIKEIEDKFKDSDNYVVHLTRYGSGGSYREPNLISVNIRNKDINKIIDIILHEIVHLKIIKYVKNCPINHWEKERIVDLIINKVLKINRWQNIDNKMINNIDKLFDKYFMRSVNLFFEEINEWKKKSDSAGG